MTGEERVVLFNPPNPLKSKIKYGGPNAVTEAVLEKAEESIAELADDFVAHVKTDIDDLREAQKKLVGGNLDPAECLKQLFHIAHNLKGKGGTFGYDLLTIISNQLCRMIERMSPPISSLATDVIELHINSIHLVHAQDLKGDGGEVGESMLNGLDQVIQKWEQSLEPREQV